VGVGVRCVGAIYGILPICAQCSVLDNSTRRASCVDGLKMGFETQCSREWETWVLDWFGTRAQALELADWQ